MGSCRPVAFGVNALSEKCWDQRHTWIRDRDPRHTGTRDTLGPETGTRDTLGLETGTRDMLPDRPGSTVCIQLPSNHG